MVLPPTSWLRGIVATNPMPKTVIVKVSRKEIHPIYQKTLVRAKNYCVHDEGMLARKGDSVIIAPAGRKLSALKSWTLVEVEGKQTDPFLGPVLGSVSSEAQPAVKKR